MKDPNKKMISVEITDELKEALRVRAFYKKMTISALIRSILEADLLTAVTEEKKTITKE